MTDIARVTMNEWDERGPHADPALRNLTLLADINAQGVARTLSRSKMLEIDELRQGVRIRTRSYVGRVAIGPLELTIQPKIPGLALIRLLRYAFSIRNLHLTTHTKFETEASLFQDLLVTQLVAEVRELLARGLLRQYVARDEWLSSPRGRIDLQRVAGGGISARTRLPCRHYIRSTDWLPNQLLLAGLKLGSRVAVDREIRSQSRQMVAELAEDVSYRRLDETAFSEWRRIRNRQTWSYDSAIQLVRLLAEGAGIMLEGVRRPLRLDGFLFDMNRLFQSLLSRFLQEHLTGFEVRDEHQLKGMMTYATGKNPKRRRDPTPRPDFAVLRAGSVITLLDAKYRDLWERKLPPAMLYQLAIYGLSQPECRDAVILYPTTDPAALESVIEVRDPLQGGNKARVVQRPVRLDLLAELLDAAGPAGRQKRRELARQCVGALDSAATSQDEPGIRV